MNNFVNKLYVIIIQFSQLFCYSVPKELREKFFFFMGEKNDMFPYEIKMIYLPIRNKFCEKKNHFFTRKGVCQTILLH